MSDFDIQLPGEIKPPSRELRNLKILIYGEPKIGKTTFASHFPGTWFIATERGQEYVACREPTFIESWEHFLNFCRYMYEKRPKEFANGDEIQTIVIDTVNALFKYCVQHVCQKLQLEDPGDTTRGKAWNMLDRSFSGTLNKLCLLPYNWVFISHDRQKQFQSTAMTINRMEPELGAAGFRCLRSLCDVIGYAKASSTAVIGEDGVPTGSFEEKRVLQLQPNNTCLAGGRIEHLPTWIPLDYQEFYKALTNPQKQNTKP